MASITKVHVNGALENKRYVAGAMKGTQDFMTATANPILEVPTACVRGVPTSQHQVL